MLFSARILRLFDPIFWKAEYTSTEVNSPHQNFFILRAENYFGIKEGFLFVLN